MIWNTDRMDYFAADFFQGMGLAMPDRWEPLIGVRNAGAIVRKGFDPTRFAIIISGGGGNGPLFPGYVGEGLADAAVIGAPFAAPNAYTIYETGKALRPEKGVLLLYNNFAGDFLNNDMAAEFLQMDGIPVESVISNDDIASAVGEERSARGGRCGIAFLIKMAANCAKRDMSLQDTAVAGRPKPFGYAEHPFGLREPADRIWGWLFRGIRGAYCHPYGYGPLRPGSLQYVAGGLGAQGRGTAICAGESPAVYQLCGRVYFRQPGASVLVLPASGGADAGRQFFKHY